MNADAPLKIAVVGGGIAGLAAAHRVRELAPDCDVQLLEAGDRLGGVLRTSSAEGFLLEDAADNFVTQVPYASELCRRLGLADELLTTNSAHRGALVLHRGKLRPIPPGFMLMAPARAWPMLTTGLLSARGKARLAAEPFVRTRRDASDESIAAFVTRRLGREVYDRLVQPLVGSIYGSDPARISLLATMPQFAAMEREHGSLFCAMRKKSREQRSSNRCQGARYSMFMAPRRGMQSIVDALACRLPATGVRLRTSVAKLEPAPARRWKLALAGASPSICDVDGVILATPAAGAAALLQELNRSVSDELRQIPYAGSILATLCYDRDAVGRALDAFGFVVPQSERRPLLSASFTSVKYPGRAPEGKVLVRVFMGGEQLPQLQERSDAELVDIAAEQLRPLLAIAGDPCFSHVVRHAAAMPQYLVGHLDRVARINRGLSGTPTLRLAGAAYHGVGVPHCIHSGEQAAEQLLAELRSCASRGRVNELSHAAIQ